MFHKLRADLQSIKDRDPAARTLWEVFWLYPGVRAVMYYRVAHWFHGKGHYHVARRLSNRARRKTGIEIHPGAKIGKGLFIDHGMGVVIGETAQIGDYCTLYQGVTLGGTGKHKGKRHPTLGNNVMVGAGAKVLGPIHIGDNVRIAAGAVVLTDIPDNCTAVGIPARVVRKNGFRVGELDQIHVPDPVAQELQRLREEVESLKKNRKKEGENHEDL